jgi:predicted transposase YbfD/YdcC
LAQSAVETAGHEAAAALELLASLQLQGATVTADAAYCNADVTHAIRERGAHYILALKGNQPVLHEHVVQCFDSVSRSETESAVQADDRHGRQERRFVRALPISVLPKKLGTPWKDLKSIVEVVRVRATKDISVTRAFYVTSHPPNAEELATRIRDHWKIENQLHHVLDVTFGEDRRKIRSEHGAQNFALVCRHALALIKLNPAKKSVAGKKRMAMWNPKNALKLLTYGFHEA